MTKSYASSEDSFKQNTFTKGEKVKKNQAISATYARREYLLRELKETDAIIHQLMSQLDLDEQYKNINGV